MVKNMIWFIITIIIAIIFGIKYNPDAPFTKKDLLRSFISSRDNVIISNNSKKIALGYNGYAEYMKTSYRFIAGLPNDASLPASVVNLNTIDSFVQQAITNNDISFREETGGEYKTKILSRVDGFYGNITYNITPKLELNAGVRAENTIRDLKYRTISDPIGSVYRKIETNELDILPSLNLKYAVSESKNIRFATSRTITRPVLFESLPITYINADGTSEKGNALLVNSTNNNIDLKFEIFPTKDELFAVTAIKIAAKNNLKVPEDISVIGFTDGIISQFSTPSISTVSQNGIKMGRKAAQMLIDRLELEDEEDEHYKTEIIETNLIIRESTTTK